MVVIKKNGSPSPVATVKRISFFSIWQWPHDVNAVISVIMELEDLSAVITCDDDNIQIIHRRLDDCHSVLNHYKWLIDAFVGVSDSWFMLSVIC